MALTFKYKSVKRPDNSQIKAPMIPLTIFGKENIDTLALLDSGVDISAMSKEMAELLGIDLNKEINFVYGIGGKVKSMQTIIKILIEHKHERYEVDLPIKIILDDYSFPLLLGRAIFFDEFVITFNQLNERIVLKKVNADKFYKQ